jgi:hypothetical protein
MAVTLVRVADHRFSIPDRPGWLFRPRARHPAILSPWPWPGRPAGTRPGLWPELLQVDLMASQGVAAPQ